MSSERDMVRTGIAERAQAGRSPPLRRRRTREYIPNSRPTARSGSDQNLHDNSVFTDELTHETRDGGFRFYTDENMNTISRPETQSHLQDILRVVPESSHLSERYQILKAENKILRERLQNALQREMKALKTFKRLAKENRQLKLNLRKYERTLLGFYDDESGMHLTCSIFFYSCEKMRRLSTNSSTRLTFARCLFIIELFRLANKFIQTPFMVVWKENMLSLYACDLLEKRSF